MSGTKVGDSREAKCEMCEDKSQSLGKILQIKQLIYGGKKSLKKFPKSDILKFYMPLSMSCKTQ
jgi:hypothetical protein